MPSVKDITSLMTNSPSSDDTTLITKAYEYAEKAHEGQKRHSGDPHFVHVFETAKTLAEFGMGPRTISAGLLHDIIEDTKITNEDIEKEFGKEILFLIQGVTKLSHLKYRGDDRHVESLRKLFVATSQDIRVLIIKLADRLHNIKTLEYAPKAKQKRIALETLEIYVPLAYRLGVRKLHRELEDYAFKHAYPKKYEETQSLLKEKIKETNKRLEKIHKSIQKAFAKEGLTNVRTYSRVKGLYSLHKKLLRKNKDIDKVYDIAALRVIVPTISDCYKALGIIHGTWRPLPNRIRDYIAFPKPNGYQSLHTTIFTGDGGIVEVQIRTEQMHKEAEYGIASHVSYKEEFKKRVINPNIVWLKQLLPKATFGSEDEDEKSSTKDRDTLLKKVDVPVWLKQLAEEQNESAEPHDFIKQLKADFFQRRIFVFTPKGDVIDLPIDSSPIDFAYAIHSDIGNHMSGGKVNGKLVSLDTKLQNGDIVEIETRKNSKPTQKWLEIAKTTMARRAIRSAILKKD